MSYANAKDRVKGWIVRSGVLSQLGRWAAPRVAIIRYHSIQENGERYPQAIGRGIIHSRSLFDQQMELLARKFCPVTMDDVADFLSGARPMPARAVVVTFDDGYADNLEVAAPVLERYGIRGIFYVTVSAVESATPPWFCRLRYAFTETRRDTWHDSVDGIQRSLQTLAERHQAFRVASKRCACRTGKEQDALLRSIEAELEVEPFQPGDGFFLRWDQVRRLRECGHLVGSHTLTHPNIAFVSEAEQRNELEGSKSLLESKLGTPVVHFSYPHPILDPCWTDATVQVSRAAGYRTAVITTAGPVERQDDPLVLRRLTVPFDTELLAWRLECTLLGRRA